MRCGATPTDADLERLAAASRTDSLAAYVLCLATWDRRTFYAGSGRVLCDELQACLEEAWEAWRGRGA